MDTDLNFIRTATTFPQKRSHRTEISTGTQTTFITVLQYSGFFDRRPFPVLCVCPISDLKTLFNNFANFELP